MITPPQTAELWFTASDIKQFVYCPRVVFYRYCMPLIRPTTYKMDTSREVHVDEATREARRSLASYGLTRGTRSFDVPVRSQRLQISGRIDMVIDTDERGGRELIPVDYKNTSRWPGRNVRVQLAAYGIMLEETRRVPVHRGFIYSLPCRRAQEVALDQALRATVEQTVAELRRLVETESMPRPTPRRRRCVACEFRRFCNDV